MPTKPEHTMLPTLKRLIRAIVTCICIFYLSAGSAQTQTISGTVKDSATKEQAGSVSVTIKGTEEFTFTDEKGTFRITTRQNLPIVLVFKSVSYETKEVAVNFAHGVSVLMTPASTLDPEGLMPIISREGKTNNISEMRLEALAGSTVAQTDKSHVKNLRKSKNQKRTAWVLAGLGAGVSIASAVNHSNKVKGRKLIEKYWASQGYTPNPPPEPIPDYTYRYVASAACFIGSAILFKAAAKNKKKAASASAFFKLEKKPVLQGLAFRNYSFPCVGVGVKL